jgi:hypothetical protein
MAIGQLPEGKKPAVGKHEGQVAVWAGDDEDVIGIVMSPEAAIETAVAMLKVASEHIGQSVCLPNVAIELLTPSDMSEDHAARILITANDAPLAIDLSAAQFVEMAAAMAALAREIG